MKKLLTLCLVFSIYFVAAQIQNEPGTIILDTGDSITGAISMYNDLNFQVFYTDSSNVQQSCSLNCVDEIAMQNGMNFTTINHYGDTAVRIFVQKIIIGPKMNLYVHRKAGNKYFVVTKDDKSYKLDIIQTEIEREGKRYQFYDKKYIGTLKYLMSDRPDMYSKIDNLSLSQNSLSKIVLEYNNDNLYYKYSPVEVARLPQSKPNFVCFAQYSNIAYAPGIGEVRDYSFGYIGGIQMYFTKGKRHSIKLNLGYWKYELTGEDQWATMTTNYDYTYERYGASITYEFDFFVSKKTNIFLNALLADFGYSINNNYQNSKEANSSFSPPELYFSPGIGFEFRPVERFGIYAELNNLISLKTLPTNFSLGLKFDFGKTTKTTSKH